MSRSQNLIRVVFVCRGGGASAGGRSTRAMNASFVAQLKGERQRRATFNPCSPSDFRDADVSGPSALPRRRVFAPSVDPPRLLSHLFTFPPPRGEKIRLGSSMLRSVAVGKPAAADFNAAMLQCSNKLGRLLIQFERHIYT